MTRPVWPVVAAASLALVIGGYLGYLVGAEAGKPPQTVTETTTLTQTLVTTSTVSLAPRPPPGHAIVLIGGAVVYAELPRTEEDFARGLSGREGLGEGRGMLFVFEREGLHSFWMYGMRFSIDIIWMDSGGRVVHIVEGAEPCAGGECVIYTPPEPARFVLEVPAGFASRHGISLGAVAEIYLEATEG